MSCDVGCRRGSDPVLLWLWCRPAAVALIEPLAWEPPYADEEGATERKKKTSGNSLVAQWTEDPVLLLLGHEFDPWPGNFYMPWLQPKEIKNNTHTHTHTHIRILSKINS